MNKCFLNFHILTYRYQHLRCTLPQLYKNILNFFLFFFLYLFFSKHISLINVPLIISVNHIIHQICHKPPIKSYYLPSRSSSHKLVNVSSILWCNVLIGECLLYQGVTGAFLNTIFGTNWKIKCIPLKFWKFKREFNFDNWSNTNLKMN